LVDDVGQTFYLYLLEKIGGHLLTIFMYNGEGLIPRMQEACIAPSIYNSWQIDCTKCGGRSLLADVNHAIFIPRKQEDKGSSVLLFYHMYFTCDTPR
jgi:hypothetical protein